MGANVFSMAIVGALVSYSLYQALIKMRLSRSIAVFTATCLGSLSTYLCTALQLALAHPAQIGGYYAAWVKFTGIFAVSQLPIAVVEGILTVLVLEQLFKFAPAEIESFRALVTRREEG